MSRKTANKQLQVVKAAAAELKVPLEDMPARIGTLLDERKKLERDLSEAKKKLAMGGGEKAEGDFADVRQVNGVKLLARAVSGIEPPGSSQPRRRGQAAGRIRRRCHCSHGCGWQGRHSNTMNEVTGKK